MRVCECGCGAEVKNRFVRGHPWVLWHRLCKRARLGDSEAIQQLLDYGWKVPPEVEHAGVLSNHEVDSLISDLKSVCRTSRGINPKVDKMLARKVWDKLAAAARWIGYTVGLEQLHSSLDGDTNFHNATIRINVNRIVARRVLTLAHELTHHFQTASGQKTSEVVAELAAFLVCGHYGFDCAKVCGAYIRIWCPNFPKREISEMRYTAVPIAREIIRIASIA